MQEEVLNFIFRLYQCMLAITSAFLKLARNRIWKACFLNPVINRINLSQYLISNSHGRKRN